MLRARGFWGAVSAIFALIALYLVLVRYTAARQITEALFQGGGNLAMILQGRQPAFR